MEQAEPYSRLAAIYDESVVDPCYSDWADFIEATWAQDSVPVRSVLDVCCGSGLMTAQLVNRGYDVVGMDASPAMLIRARGLLGPAVPLHRIVLPELAIEDCFDAAVSTFDGFNYLTPDDFRRGIQAVANRLRPGGWFIFDLHADAMLAFAHKNNVVEGESGGNQFVLRNAVDLAERICESTIDVTSDNPSRSFREVHRQYLHLVNDVESALADAGFTEIRDVHEYTNTPVERTTLRATWIARRAS